VVSAEEVDQEFDKSYGQLRKQVAVPGFRPGKVPRRVLERRFGDHVKAEVAQELIQSKIEEALSELDLDLVSPPHVLEEGLEEGVEPGKELAFSIELETKAEFELPEYKGIEVTRTVPQVTDEHVEKVLSSMADERATWQPAPDDTYEPNDVVYAHVKILDGEESLFDDEAVLDGESPQVGDFVLEGLDEVLKGARVGAKSTVQARRSEEAEGGESPTFPATLEIQEIKRRTVPPIDDDLARELGHDDLQSLREEIRKDLAHHAEKAADKAVVEQILEKLVAEADIPIAEGPTQRMLEKRLNEAAIQMLMSGVEGEKVREIMEAEKESLKESIETDTRRWLLIEKIAEKEKIFALEDDVDARIEAVAREHGTTPTKVREFYEEKGHLPEVRASILEEKVCAFLLKNARITEKEEGSEADPAEDEEEASTEE